MLVVAVAVGFAGLAGVGTAPAAHEQEATDRAYVVATPEDVDWVKDPPPLEPGARLALLMGDPANAEPLAMRLILPSDYAIAPHTHPAIEQGIVLSGTLHIGFGEQLDEDAAKRLPAGSYFAIAPGTPHYVFTGHEPVTLQVQSTGPWEIRYVDPADDPRND